MNAKHYVSLEAAKKLKELGYNESTEFVHVDNEPIFNGISINYLKPELCNGYKVEDNTCYPCPTLLEAMDWLESKDIHMEVRMRHMKIKGDPYKVADTDEYQWQYYYAICKGDDVEHPIIGCDESYVVIMYTDRNECMQKAIEKALE